MRRVLPLFVLLWVGCAPPACSDAEDRALVRDARLVAQDDGPAGEAAAARLSHQGARAVVVLETALYDADARGRIRVIKALQGTRDPAAAPVLAHLARRDEDPQVRAVADAARGRL